MEEYRELQEQYKDPPYTPYPDSPVVKILFHSVSLCLSPFPHPLSIFLSELKVATIIPIYSYIYFGGYFLRTRTFSCKIIDFSTLGTLTLIQYF